MKAAAHLPRPLPTTLYLAWNAANRAAREDYEARPNRACVMPECDGLAALHHRYCKRHRRGK